MSTEPWDTASWIGVHPKLSFALTSTFDTDKISDTRDMFPFLQATWRHVSPENKYIIQMLNNYKFVQKKRKKYW